MKPGKHHLALLFALFLAAPAPAQQFGILQNLSAPEFVELTQLSPSVTKVSPTVQTVLPEIRGTITEFTVPTPHGEPAGLTEGLDGNLWFVENWANKLASFNVTTHEFLEYRIPVPNSFPVRITADTNGNLWFTQSAGLIGEFTVATHTFREFPIPTPGSSPFEIVLTTTGIWFTEQGTSKIGNLSNGLMAEYSTPTRNSEPNGMTVGDDGTIWFTEAIGKIGKFEPNTQAFTEYDVPDDGSPFEITRGPDPTFWFSIQDNDGIGRITDAGEITRFAIPTHPSRPYDLTLGPDGAIWFEEGTGNKIGRITPQGRVTNEYPIPTLKSGAHAMTSSPRLGVWFSEILANKIASIATR
jgi:virginiamycin B lyase